MFNNMWFQPGFPFGKRSTNDGKLFHIELTVSLQEGIYLLNTFGVT